MKFTFLRFQLILTGVFFSSGYRVAQSSFGTPMTWYVTKENPVVWVEICDEVRETMFNFYQFPAGDTLEYAYADADQIISSIFDDFNSISDSFLELRWQNDEYLDPAASKAPRQTANDNEAKFKTITVCTNTTSYDSVAHAAPQSNDSLCKDSEFKSANSSYCKLHRIAECEIVLDLNYIKQGTDVFTHVLTHEIGHCLGLLHNHETTRSVMSYFTNRQMEIRLSLDDKLGISYLYPKDQSRTKQSVDFGLSQCSQARL